MASLKEKPTIELIEQASSLDREATQDFSDIDEKKLLRKLDWRLMPLFTILYLMSFLDRGNIGNAKIEGLAEDLNLHGNQYNMCLTIFFIFYATFEIPSNAILRHVKPKLFIPLTMMIWSIVMTLMGTVKNYHQLLATRALLGIFEAALFPGISFMLSMYYKKNEILVREAIFFSAASMAGAFSGLLAAAISQMDGVGGYEGWRWIFILEGLLTFVVSVIAYFYFPLYPSESTFLTPREREFITYKVKYSSNSDGLTLRKKAEGDVPAPVSLGEDETNRKEFIWAVLKDWQTWCMVMLFYGVGVPIYGVSLFCPTIIKNLGYTSTKAQLMTAPIYIVSAICSIVQAVISDKVGLRSPFLIFNYTCMLVGYIMCVAINPTQHPGAVLGALYVIAFGMYSAFPLVVIWFSNNLSGTYKRAVGMAFQIGMGNYSGAFASNFYRTKDLPHFILGHSLVLGFISLGMIFLLITILGYTYSNNKRKRDVAAGIYDSYSDEELLRLGDKSPYFVYRL